MLRKGAAVDVDSAYELVSRAIALGRPANGYLVVGSIRGQAMEFAERILSDVCGGLVRERANPDVHWLLPAKKTRIISVDMMRERLVDPISRTSFSGGWKAGVIVGADRLNDSSGNAFLKTLEEPPPRTLFLLLTELPEQVLTTVVSRCQRIDLDDARSRKLSEPHFSQVLDALSAPGSSGAASRMALAARLAAVLAELKSEAGEEIEASIADARKNGPGEEVSKDEFEAMVLSLYIERRADFMRLVVSWFRDIMAVALAGDDAPLANEPRRHAIVACAARLTPAVAFRNVEAVDALFRMFGRNMPEEPALAAFVQRLSFEAEPG